MPVGHDATSETLPLVRYVPGEGKKVQRKNAGTAPAVPAPVTRGGACWWLQADTLGGEGFRDRLLHPIEEAGPSDRDHDRRDQCQNKGSHGVLPLTLFRGRCCCGPCVGASLARFLLR